MNVGAGSGTSGINLIPRQDKTFQLFHMVDRMQADIRAFFRRQYPRKMILRQILMADDADNPDALSHPDHHRIGPGSPRQPPPPVWDAFHAVDGAFREKRNMPTSPQNTEEGAQ